MPRASLVFPVVACGLTLVVVVFSTTASSQKATSPKQPDKQLVERGAYLVRIMGCGDCHTPGFFYGAPDQSRQLSGSELGWKGPWGVSYAANLTPDPETGLGKWTDEQIITALRTGVRPDKTTLRPPMPWPNFAEMHDEDLRAIVAYLRSIPPIKHQEPKALPPEATAAGSYVELPPPPAWDAPRGPAGTSGTKGKSGSEAR